MTNNIFDPNFNVKPVSIAMGHMINTVSLEMLLPKRIYNDKNFIEKLTFKTFPFYNDRERSVAIAFGFISRKQMVICFGENRNSTQIFVEVNGNVDVEDAPSKCESTFNEETYKLRSYFDWDKMNDAVEHIQDLILTEVIRLHGEKK